MMLALAGLTVVLAVAGQAAPPVTTIDRVDLDRYLGRWYEISRFPNRFQDDCTGNVRATYSRRQDGRIDVLNECATAKGTKQANGVARVVDRQSNAKLKVRFAPAWLSWLPAVWGDYWVIGLADDYSWAVVGDPSRKYLWVLARTAELDQRNYDAALKRASANGFDVGALVRTPQSGQREK